MKEVHSLDLSYKEKRRKKPEAVFEGVARSLGEKPKTPRQFETTD